jgi:hypothetical protein
LSFILDEVGFGVTADDLNFTFDELDVIFTLDTEGIGRPFGELVRPGFTLGIEDDLEILLLGVSSAGETKI